MVKPCSYMYIYSLDRDSPMVGCGVERWVHRNLFRRMFIGTVLVSFFIACLKPWTKLSANPFVLWWNGDEVDSIQSDDIFVIHPL